MEATYSLEKGVVKAICRVVDFSGYPGSSPDRVQECPAFYCVEPLNRFVYYSGDKPWTNDKNLSYENDLIFWPDAGYPHFKSTENWSAFIGDFDDSFGIGLYVPNDVEFLAGVFDRENALQKTPQPKARHHILPHWKDILLKVLILHHTHSTSQPEQLMKSETILKQ